MREGSSTHPPWYLVGCVAFAFASGWALGARNAATGGVLGAASIASVARAPSADAHARGADDDEEEEDISNRPRRLQHESSLSCPLESLLGLGASKSSRAVAQLMARLPAEARELIQSPLHQHGGSKTILQDAFVRFHHLLYMHSPPLLPIHEWGARGMRNRTRDAVGWTREAFSLLSPMGHARPSVLPRLAHNGWVLGQAHRASTPNSTCLGWDNTEYIDLLPGCQSGERWSFRFEARPRQRGVDRRRRLIKGDLTLPVPGSESRFDVVICNQVFEHVERPIEAVRVLFAMLKPRGLLFWSAPFNERFHLIPGDFYRYTVLGARRLLTDAGLTIVHTQRWGDSMITSGYMLGFGAGDYPPKYLERQMLADVGQNVQWLEKKPNMLYINVAIVAEKPGQ